MSISATEQWNAFVNTMFSSFSKPTVGITTAGSLLVILLVSVWYLNKNKKNSRKDENDTKKLGKGDQIAGTTATASTSNESKGTSNDEKKTKTDAPSLPSSILDIHRNTGKVGSSSSSKRNNNSAKKAQAPPSSSSDKRGFGSSYYYAHNSSGTGGGYKDGLKMEDYTMNQPRLLSKGGVVVDNAATAKNADNVFDKVYTTAAQSSVVMQDDKNEDAEQQQQLPAKQEASSSRQSSSTPPSAKEEEAPPIRKNTSSQQILQNSTLITRYGWEDTPELSKIRIDSLPHPQSTLTNPKTPISWKDANIPKTGVVAKLINQNKGLFVTFQSSNDDGDDDRGERYHLHLPSLYGEASDVKTLWKPNKFIVKIVKRSGKHQKTWGALTGTTKGSGNSGGGGIGKDGFDEDLLNQVAFGGRSSGRPLTDGENDDAANKSGGKGIFSSFLS